MSNNACQTRQSRIETGSYGREKVAASFQAAALQDLHRK